MCYSGLTSYLRVRSVIQLRQHDLEDLKCFVIAFCALKRCMLHLVSKIRRRVDFDDLRITRISTDYKTIDVIAPYAHQQALHPIAFFPTLPYYVWQRWYWLLC